LGERKKVTLHDIARAAGVSVATVDRVFNKRAPVRGQTRNRVEEALRRLETGPPQKLPRVSPEAAKPLRFDFVLHSGHSFVGTMTQAMHIIGQGFNRHRVTFQVHPLVTFDSAALSGLLLDVSRDSDGIALISREHAAITAAVNRIIAEGVPVVTLTTDLPETRRIGYVGINNVSAGRTAGSLMGRFTGGREGEVILVVSGSYRAQAEREMGFRSILRETYPNLTVRESINSDDRSEESYQRMGQLFAAGHRPLGVYNVAGGNTGIARAMADFALSRKVAFIGHELNDDSHHLLAHGEMDAVIDQDTRAEVFMAANTLLSHHGRELVRPILTPAPPLVVLRENVADVTAYRERRWQNWRDAGADVDTYPPANTMATEPLRA